LVFFVKKIIANIDIITEEIIQDVVKNDFADSTMLIIGHRIQTVQHCDRIMVLDGGRLVEFGSPNEMRNKEGSYLKEIWDKTVNSG
jgi:ABC-type multidrug transport system fused ATPase/permease subunit